MALGGSDRRATESGANRLLPDSFPRRSTSSESVGVRARVFSAWRLFRVLLGWAWALAIGHGVAQSAPFFGEPLKLPGRIEAEHYDLGAEGVAYHGRGLQDTNHGVVVTFPPGRPGSLIPEYQDFRSTNVVLRAGEWVNFTVEVAEDGYFSALFRTYGVPISLGACEDPRWFPPCVYWGAAVVRAEVDGVNSTGLVEIRGPETLSEHPLISRCWMTRGVHQIRFAVESVENMDPPWSAGWAALYTGTPGAHEIYQSMSIAVDSIRFLPAVTPFRLEMLAGGDPGFQDGQGSEAQFEGPNALLGELSSGELVVVDTGNSAIRLVSKDGSVRTLAGNPKNPVRDGLGTNAGFGSIVHAVLGRSGHVLVLERDSGASDGVRQVELGGDVTTLFSGNATATFYDFSGQKFQQEVPLSQIRLMPSGKPELLGMFSHFEMTGTGPIFPEYGDVVRVVAFTIEGGKAQQDRFLPDGLPDLSILNFGDGFFSEGNALYSNLFFKDPDGVLSELTPGINFTSILRSTEGAFFITDGKKRAGLGRLVPGVDLSRLSVFPRGAGTVSGVPKALVLPSDEIWIEATPWGIPRFTRFLEWSDGSTENPRSLRIEKDTFLEAIFGTVLPDPHGVVPGSVLYSNSGAFEFNVVGNSRPYFYQVEGSQDLQDWKLMTKGIVVKAIGGFVGGRAVDGIVEARLPQTRVSVSTATHQIFLRVQLLDR